MRTTPKPIGPLVLILSNESCVIEAPPDTTPPGLAKQQTQALYQRTQPAKHIMNGKTEPHVPKTFSQNRLRNNAMSYQKLADAGLIQQAISRHREKRHQQKEFKGRQKLGSCQSHFTVGSFCAAEATG